MLFYNSINTLWNKHLLFNALAVLAIDGRFNLPLFVLMRSFFFECVNLLQQPPHTDRSHRKLIVRQTKKKRKSMPNRQMIKCANANPLSSFNIAGRIFVPSSKKKNRFNFRWFSTHSFDSSFSIVYMSIIDIDDCCITQLNSNANDSIVQQLVY